MDFNLFVDLMVFIIGIGIGTAVAWSIMDVVSEIRQANALANKAVIIRDQGATAWINQLPTYDETLERVSRGLVRFPQWRFDMEYVETTLRGHLLENSYNWKEEGF